MLDGVVTNSNFKGAGYLSIPIKRGRRKIKEVTRDAAAFIALGTSFIIRGSLNLEDLYCYGVCSAMIIKLLATRRFLLIDGFRCCKKI